MRAIIAVFVTAAFIAVPAFAHHGWSSYDEKKVVTVSAPVLTVKWQQPHAEITINHESATWNVVLAPVSRLETRGLAQAALTVGKTVQVEAYPRRDGTKEFRAERVIVDGKTIELR